MSTKFHAYRFPKRNLWKIQQELRSYLLSTHQYAVVSMAMAIAEYRRVKRLGVDGHSEICATRYLGQCSCDMFDNWRHLRDWITQKQQNQNGLEGQCVEVGSSYVMRLVGAYHWENCIPDALLLHLGIGELWYYDNADIPTEDKPNRIVARKFDEAIDEGRYFVMPLCTVEDCNRLWWHMNVQFARLIRDKDKG